MMNGATRNKTVRGALDGFVREGLIDAATYRRLAELYPTTRWDWHSLGRWFLIFGAVSCAAGAFILLHNFFDFTLPKLAWMLGLASAGLLAGGMRLKQRAFVWSARALELLAAFALIGLSFTLGMIYSSGSGNWPALLLIDLVFVLGLSYALNNVLLLILAASLFFVWFGGVTGYESGWGAYWFGMNYPLRFVAAAVTIIAVSLLHAKIEHGSLARYRGFFKVWLSSGLFFGEMAFWLLSIFGNFGAIDDYGHHAAAAELVLFNAVWAAFNATLIYAGAKHAFRMVTGYGATFLIIQLYTLFFTYLAEGLGAFMTLFIASGSALGLALYLEKRRREAQKTGAHPA